MGKFLCPICGDENCNPEWVPSPNLYVNTSYAKCPKLEFIEAMIVLQKSNQDPIF